MTELEFENEAALNAGVYLRPEPAGFIRLSQSYRLRVEREAVVLSFNSLLKLTLYSSSL